MSSDSPMELDQQVTTSRNRQQKKKTKRKGKRKRSIEYNPDIWQQQQQKLQEKIPSYKSLGENEEDNSIDSINFVPFDSSNLQQQARENDYFHDRLYITFDHQENIFNFYHYELNKQFVNRYISDNDMTKVFDVLKKSHYNITHINIWVCCIITLMFLELVAIGILYLLHSQHIFDLKTIFSFKLIPLIFVIQFLILVCALVYFFILRNTNTKRSKNILKGYNQALFPYVQFQLDKEENYNYISIIFLQQIPDNFFEKETEQHEKENSNANMMNSRNQLLPKRTDLKKQTSNSHSSLINEIIDIPKAKQELKIDVVEENAYIINELDENELEEEVHLGEILEVPAIVKAQKQYSDTDDNRNTNLSFVHKQISEDHKDDTNKKMIHSQKESTSSDHESQDQHVNVAKNLRQIEEHLKDIKTLEDVGYIDSDQEEEKNENHDAEVQNKPPIDKENANKRYYEQRLIPTTNQKYIGPQIISPRHAQKDDNEKNNALQPPPKQSHHGPQIISPRYAQKEEDDVEAPMWEPESDHESQKNDQEQPKRYQEYDYYAASKHEEHVEREEEGQQGQQDHQEEPKSAQVNTENAPDKQSYYLRPSQLYNESSYQEQNTLEENGKSKQIEHSKRYHEYGDYIDPSKQQSDQNDQEQPKRYQEYDYYEASKHEENIEREEEGQQGQQGHQEEPKSAQIQEDEGAYGLRPYENNYPYQDNYQRYEQPKKQYLEAPARAHGPQILSPRLALKEENDDPLVKEIITHSQHNKENNVQSPVYHNNNKVNDLIKKYKYIDTPVNKDIDGMVQKYSQYNSQQIDMEIEQSQIQYVSQKNTSQMRYSEYY